jgi:hypothetical protein
VWAVYLAVDPRLRVRFPHPLAEHFHSTAASVIRLLPLPRTYRLGLLYQSALEQRDFPVTMFGHTYPHGTWLFWPATLLVKTPLPLLVLGAVGAVVAVRQRRADVAAYVLLPAAVWFVIIVAGTSRPFGSRYLLLVPVLLAICAGAVVGDRLPRGRPRLLLAAAAVTLTVVTAVGSFLTYPYYLTYSNVAFGGSARTYHSLPQDADWDQDLRRVASYLRRHGVTGPIWWREHGGQPSAYGVQAVRATSAATVQGWLVVFGVERQFVDDSPRLRHLRPVAVIGNDVFVYQVP